MERITPRHPLSRRHREVPSGRPTIARPQLPDPEIRTQKAVSLHLALLGPFQMRRQATEIGPLPKKAQGLLAYLALHPGQALARERLAALLWGDARSEQARRSLRECLRSIRAIMGGDAKDALAADGNGGRLALPKNTDVDATRFEQLVRSSRLEDLEAAHGLYRGEFLAELHIASEPFEEWLMLER